MCPNSAAYVLADYLNFCKICFFYLFSVCCLNQKRKSLTVKLRKGSGFQKPFFCCFCWLDAAHFFRLALDESGCCTLYQYICVKFIIIVVIVFCSNRNFLRWKRFYISYQSTSASEGEYAIFTCNKQFWSISDNSWWRRKRYKPRQFRIKTQVCKERLVGDRQVYYLRKQDWLRIYFF